MWVEQQIRNFDGSYWAVIHQERGGRCPYTGCLRLLTHQHALHPVTRDPFPIVEPYREEVNA